MVWQLNSFSQLMQKLDLMALFLFDYIFLQLRSYDEHALVKIRNILPFVMTVPYLQKNKYLNSFPE